MRSASFRSAHRAPRRLVVALSAVTLLLALSGTARAVGPPFGEDEGGASAASVLVAPDRTGVATPEAPFTWAGAVATGLNQSFDPAAPDTCGKAVENYCDVTLIDVQPGDLYSRFAGGIEFSIGGAAPGTDLDLFVYASDASGLAGEFVGASAGPTDVERVSVMNGQGFYLVVVVYFNATDTGYDGRAEFFSRSLTPADVDDPAGLQDVLVSDPGRGFRSHSEPHLSQDP